MVNDNVVEVVIGSFGVPNRNGDVYMMPRTELTKALDRMVGRQVGEIGQRQISTDISFGNYCNALHRVTKLDAKNSAGVLLDYHIKDLPLGSQVIGKVALNPNIVGEIRESVDKLCFGIRALTKPSKDNKIKDIINLVSFDYLPPWER